MNNFLKILLPVFFSGFVMGGIVLAEDSYLQTMTDKFYFGLAKIIEQYENKPEECVMEVNRYYEKNHPLIEQIRKEAQEMLEQTTSATEECSTGNKGNIKSSEQKTEEPEMSIAMKKYSDVLEAFIEKYPNEGVEITMKALLLLPDISFE